MNEGLVPPPLPRDGLLGLGVGLGRAAGRLWGFGRTGRAAGLEPLGGRDWGGRDRGGRDRGGRD